LINHTNDLVDLGEFRGNSIVGNADAKIQFRCRFEVDAGGIGQRDHAIEGINVEDIRPTSAEHIEVQHLVLLEVGIERNDLANGRS